MFHSHLLFILSMRLGIGIFTLPLLKLHIIYLFLLFSFLFDTCLNYTYIPFLLVYTFLSILIYEMDVLFLNFFHIMLIVTNVSKI